MNILISVLLILSLLFLSGCATNDIIYLNKEVCRQPGTYCHTFLIDNGTANISFPSVVNGTFNYSVED